MAVGSIRMGLGGNVEILPRATLQDLVSGIYSHEQIMTHLSMKVGRGEIKISQGRITIGFHVKKISDPVFWRAFFCFVKNCSATKGVDSFVFEYGSMSNECWRIFVEELREFKFVSLHFTMFEMTGEACSVLSDYISNRGLVLKDLALENDATRTHLLVPIADLCRLLVATASDLQSMALIGASLTSKDLNLIRTVITGHSKLSCLFLEVANIKDRHILSLVDIIRDTVLLHTLSLRGNCLTDDGLMQLSSGFLNLKSRKFSLDISYNLFITAQSVQHLLKIAPGITSLALDGCNVNSVKVLIPATSPKREFPMEEIRLRGTRVGDVAEVCKEMVKRRRVPESVKLGLKLPLQCENTDELIKSFPNMNVLMEDVSSESEFERIDAGAYDDPVQNIRQLLSSTDPFERKLGLKHLKLNKSEEGWDDIQKDQLFEMLLANEYEIKDVDSDGNCFFSVISMGVLSTYSILELIQIISKKEKFEWFQIALSTNRLTQQVLRQSVVRYMRDNKEKYEVFFGEDETFEAHCARMEKDKIFAEHVEIQAMQDFLKEVGFDISLTIFNLRSGVKINEAGKLEMPSELTGTPNTRNIYIFNPTEHFKLLKPIQS